MNKQQITYTVCECSEFHSMGAYHDKITDVKEALIIYDMMQKSMIPAIGVQIHTPGTEDYEDVQADIFIGHRLDLDILDYIPEIKNNPEAMVLVHKLVQEVRQRGLDKSVEEQAYNEPELD